MTGGIRVDLGLEEGKTKKKLEKFIDRSENKCAECWKNRTTLYFQ